jgi:hypothetical protein
MGGDHRHGVQRPGVLDHDSFNKERKMIRPEPQSFGLEYRRTPPLDPALEAHNDVFEINRAGKNDVRHQLSRP